MKRSLLILGTATVHMVMSASAVAEDVYGFLPANAAEQLERESQFASYLDAANLHGWMQRMTTRPHHAGSPKAKENAEFVAELFRSWGYSTQIETYYVLFPTPVTRELEMLSPEPFRAALRESIAGRDSAAVALEAEGLPPYNAYAMDGEVSGDLVYVNQGLPRDYEVLNRHGIDVRGKVVIARYGGSWRGIKPKVAAEKGAIGCLIFNDPEDDGYSQGDAYPEGPYKHESAVQRGSIVDLPKRPGDPLTPGYGATRDAERLDIAESGTVMTIPVLPLARADAQPLLEALEGPVAPGSWRGALPITYRLGGDGTVSVRMKTQFSWDLVPAYNVIARMEGSLYPDQWIVRGNHHDAWVIGARDPISGLVALLEQARAFAELAQTGWRPRRTIVFCAWDAEEPGLLGSVEWAEHHAGELREKAVAYINTDGNARGFLRIGGSHALEALASQVAHAVTDPQTRVSVAERARARTLVHGSPDDKQELQSTALFPIYALGSGSDYSAFIQHLGIASLNVSFGGEGRGGEYHTSFDTFDHYTRFLDPDFAYGVALAEVCGRLTLRLADADLLPFDFARSAAAFSDYLDEVKELADTEREDINAQNELLEKNYHVLAADPAETYVAPEIEEPAPFFNFAPLENAMRRLDEAAERYTAARGRWAGAAAASHASHPPADALLYQSERALIDDSGLPRRPWFRHQIYAPGYYTGYGVKTLPGVREAIEERQWGEVESEIENAAAAINRFTDLIEEVNRHLSAP